MPDEFSNLLADRTRVLPLVQVEEDFADFFDMGRKVAESDLGPDQEVGQMIGPPLDKSDSFHQRELRWNRTCLEWYLSIEIDQLCLLHYDHVWWMRLRRCLSCRLFRTLTPP